MRKIGIPTTYHGVRFRSRLEAKWAAFFDLLRWKWQYEPYDLNGWIPDFLLPGRCPVLVEVKPISAIDHTVCHEMWSAARSARFNGELLLAGCVVPVPASDVVAGATIGWLFDGHFNGIGFGQGWDSAILGDYRGVGGDLGLCHAVGDYSDRITGKHDGDHCFDDNVIHRAQQWAHAGNLVQWKAA